jgi:CheY-like chemotaxis protein
MLKALIINDQKDYHTVLKHKFKNKISFDSAYDGVQGLKLLENDYELIFLDLQMPILDGFGVLERMTDEQKEKTVVMSYLLDPGAEVGTKQRGCKHFLDGGADKVEIERVLFEMGVLEVNE